MLYRSCNVMFFCGSYTGAMFKVQFFVQPLICCQYLLQWVKFGLYFFLCRLFVLLYACINCVFACSIPFVGVIFRPLVFTAYFALIFVMYRLFLAYNQADYRLFLEKIVATLNATYRNKFALKM